MPSTCLGASASFSRPVAHSIEDAGMRHISEAPRRMVQTRTGLVIGIRHQPKPRAASSDAELVQSALLDPLTEKPLSMRMRVWRKIARWL